MKSPLIDETGDVVFKNGDLVMIEGDEELAQGIRVLLETSLEEWFLDPDFGLDRNSILVKKFNEMEATDAIIEALEAESQIAFLEKITFAITGRSLTIDLSLLKANGEVLDIEGVEFDAG